MKSWFNYCKQKFAAPVPTPTDVVHGAGDVVGDVAGGVGDVASGVGNAVTSAPGAVGKVAGDVGGAVGDAAGGVGGAVGDVAGSVGDVAGGVAGGVGDVAGGVGGAVGDVAGGVAKAAPIPDLSKFGPRTPTGDGDDNRWSFWCAIKSWFNWCTQRGAPKAYSDPYDADKHIGDTPLSDDEASGLVDSLEAQMNKALEAGEKFDKSMEEGIEQIHPHSTLKWWRYRYEYSYVEDLILIIILSLTGLWDICFHQPMQALVQVYLAPKESAWLDAGTSNKLYKRWMNHFFGTITSLTLTGLTLWALIRTGFLEWFPKLVVKYTPEITNLPTELASYKFQAEDVF